jgi:ATP adenylyltransferase
LFNDDRDVLQRDGGVAMSEMDMLYTPWREEFVLGPRDDECIFCEPEKRKHVRELILYRGNRVFVVLNRYPYNTGHLMVVPYRHIARLEDLKQAEANEIINMVRLSSGVMNERLQPAGMNVGMNLGQAGGAGIEGHLHVHLVPRWVGDTNFMPVAFKTRVLSVGLDTVRKRLKPGFDALKRANRSK